MENKIQESNRITLKKKRCAFGECKQKVAPIIGTCSYCTHKFCALHRLPEAHVCADMQKCREQSFKKNENRLLEQKCVAAKV